MSVPEHIPTSVIGVFSILSILYTFSSSFRSSASNAKCILAKDTIKAMRRFEEEKPLTMKKKIKLAAPCYIPTIITGITTVLCICCSNKINKNMVLLY